MQEDEFEEIIKSNDLESVFSDSRYQFTTIGDMYEGIAILSNVQADLHSYLLELIQATKGNIEAGEEIYPVKPMPTEKVRLLLEIFELAAKYSE